MSTVSQSLPGSFASRHVRRARLFLSFDAVAHAASLALLVAVLFLSAGVVGLALYGYSHANRIYEGVTVGGVPIGGLTQTEARARLEARFGEYIETPLIVVVDGKEYRLDLSSTGAALDPDETVRSSFAFGREGFWWGRTRAWARAAVHGRELLLTVNIDRDRLDALLTQMGSAVTRPASDASIAMSGPDGPQIVPESAGVALDLEVTRRAVVDRLRRLSHEPVTLATAPVEPAVIGADLQDELDVARSVVGRSFVVSGLDRSWDLSPDDLTQIVSVESGNVVEVDREAVKTLVRDILAEIEQPSIDASIDVGSDGTIDVRPGQSSIDVEMKPSVDSIVTALQSGLHEAALTINQRAPAISDEQAAAAVARADRLVGDGLRLRWDGGSVDLGRGDLLAALRIDVDPRARDSFVIGFDRDRLALLLAPIAEEVDVAGRDATFRLVGSKVTVAEKAVVGRRLDVDATVAAIEGSALTGGSREVDLVVRAVEPRYTDDDAKKIKLDDVLAASSTYYGESSDARQHNVERAAELETGWLVPPGGQFSYDQYVGMVTEAEGFVTGFGIVASAEGDGRVTTAPVVGGGICQVSTTIFQAAFWAGLQIDERYEHPYWMQTYGEPPRGMKGLDAMVNIEKEASLDMRFTNTTDDWIAIVVVADGQNVQAEIRGTETGWTVEIEEPVITEVVPADETSYYTESPELPAGEEMQVEHAQEGFTATVHRVVRDKDGTIIDETGLTSTYAASRNTILRGTGEVEG
jgi:vancomycin resistance protein YoaR